MRKAYRKIVRMNNAVEAAAPRAKWGKDAPRKGGRTTNSEIGESMIHREMKDQKKGRC